MHLNRCVTRILNTNTQFNCSNRKWSNDELLRQTFGIDDAQNNNVRRTQQLAACLVRQQDQLKEFMQRIAQNVLCVCLCEYDLSWNAFGRSCYVCAMLRRFGIKERRELGGVLCRLIYLLFTFVVMWSVCNARKATLTPSVALHSAQHT